MYINCLVGENIISTWIFSEAWMPALDYFYLRCNCYVRKTMQFLRYPRYTEYSQPTLLGVLVWPDDLPSTPSSLGFVPDVSIFWYCMHLAPADDPSGKNPMLFFLGDNISRKMLSFSRAWRADPPTRTGFLDVYHLQRAYAKKISQWKAAIVRIFVRKIQAKRSNGNFQFKAFLNIW